MEQKIKFIIIGLSAVLLVSLLFTMQTLTQKQRLTRERDSLKEDNAILSKRFEKAKQDNQGLQEKLNTLNQQLEELAKSRDDLQKKLSEADKARQELAGELKTLKEKNAEVKESAEPLSGDAYWAAIFKQKKDLELQLENLRADFKNLQISNEQLQREKNSLELEAADLKREKQDLTRQFEFAQKQLDYNRKMIDTISLEVVGEKNDKTQIQDLLKTIKNENMALRRQLKGLSDRKITLERQLAQTQDKNGSLEGRIKELDVLLQEKIIQLSKISKNVDLTKQGRIKEGAAQETQEPVQLSPIVVKPNTESSFSQESTPALGKILAVNRDNNFVVVDLGEDSGIRVGDVFKAYNKEGNSVGTVKVIEVRKAISACDIYKETSPIKVGDTVR